MDLPFPPDPPTAVPPHLYPHTPPPPVAANPTPAPSLHDHHPPYAEMITAAISALNERNGSSKRAIAKYIETHYLNLPATHSALLTNQLKRLKLAGQILLVKQSYKLPGSAPPDPVDAIGAINPLASSDPSSTAPKRRPGRPPKPKPDSMQAAVPVFATSTDINAVPQLNGDAAAGKVNGPPVRGRGRPPKRSGAKRGPGRPPKVGAVGGGGRGRPRKNPILAARKKGLGGRPRGRPRKTVNVMQGLAAGGAGKEAAPVGGIATVGMKRRGRPPKAGGMAKKPRNFTSVQPKMPRKLSGKPLGRPRKNESKKSDSQLLVAYLDLKSKLESLQSRIQQTATFVKPSVNNEAAFNALQELELIAMNISVPPTAQNQNQNQNQNQHQHQHQHQYQQPPMPPPQPEQSHPQPPLPEGF